MAKLYFHYSTMNAGKSTLLLQASHNYREMDMRTYLLTSCQDTRAQAKVGDTQAHASAKVGKIRSRIGIEATADTYDRSTDMFEKIGARLAQGPCDCVLIDEAQWMSRAQVWQCARAVDDLHIPVMCYGLRVDFRGQLFPGSAALLAWADEMREVRTICRCGKKATMVVRRGPDGGVLKAGPQVQVGGNETYVALCRRHFRQEMGDLKS